MDVSYPADISDALKNPEKLEALTAFYENRSTSQMQRITDSRQSETDGSDCKYPVCRRLTQN